MKSPKVEDAAVLCMVVGAMMYLNTLDCGLCFDDEQAIIKNADIRPETPWSNLLRNDFWGTPMVEKNSHKSYRPLCVATFRLNYLLHELQPMGYHLVNVLLHGAVCYLYVQLCGVVFSQVWPALIAGLLFAVHPIHTEAVAGVVGRADVLATSFFLVCLLSYHHSLSCRGGLGYYIWMVVALLSCSCSALSKELGITAAALCLALDILVVQKCHLLRFNSVQQLLKALQRPFLIRVLILSCYVIAFMTFRLSIMKQQPLIGNSLNPAAGQPSPYRQLHWAYLCFYNFWLLLCPAHLSPDYSMGTIPLIVSLIDYRNTLTMVMLSSLAYMALSLCIRRGIEKKKGIALFGLMLTIVPFLPASNLFFPVGFVVAERVLYLPSMGFCMLVAYGACHLMSTLSSHRLRILSGVAVASLLFLHSVRTFERNRDWVSEHLLYRQAIRTHPTNAKMLHNLATRITESDLVVAEKLLRMSSEVEPKYVSAFSDLGFVLSQQNKVERAEEVYWKAVELTYQALNGDAEVTSSVKNLKTFTRLAKLLKRNSNRLHEAYQLCDNITTHLSRRGIPYPKLYAEMGDILLRLGQYHSAREAIVTAIRQDPRNVVAIQTLSKLEAQQGNVTAAELILRRAMERLGLQLPLVLDIASHLLHHHHDNAQSMKEAEHLLLQVLLFEATNTEALLTLGQIYSVSILSQPSKAIKLFTKLLKQTPTHEEAMFSLAKVYSQQGQCKEATDVLDDLLKIGPRHTEVARKLLEAC